MAAGLSAAEAARAALADGTPVLADGTPVLADGTSVLADGPSLPADRQPWDRALAEGADRSDGSELALRAQGLRDALGRLDRERAETALDRLLGSFSSRPSSPRFCCPTLPASVSAGNGARR